MLLIEWIIRGSKCITSILRVECRLRKHLLLVAESWNLHLLLLVVKIVLFKKRKSRTSTQMVWLNSKEWLGVISKQQATTG